MASNTNGQTMPDDTARPSRRRALSVLAASVPAIATAGQVNAAAMPSREFLECKALFNEETKIGEIYGNTSPNSPDYDRYQEQYGEAGEKFDVALDRLIATPHTRQKMEELITLAAYDEDLAPFGLENYDERQIKIMAAARDTFKAIGGCVNV